MIDSITVIILAVILFFPLNSINSKLDYYTKAFNNYYSEYSKSGLFSVVEKDNIKTIDEAKPQARYNEYGEALYNYYISYSNKSVYWFNVHILGLEDVLNRYSNETLTTSNYFVYVGDSYEELGVIKETSTSFKEYNDSLNASQVGLENKIAYYLKTKYSKSVSEFNTLMSGNNLFRYTSLAQLVPYGASLLISVIIFSFIVPLFDRDSRTIGKVILKQSVITDNGYYLPKGRTALRGFVLVLEVILTLPTFGGILLISYTTTWLSKKHKSIHDMVAGTIVVESRDSIWYLDEEAKKKALGENNASE